MHEFFLKSQRIGFSIWAKEDFDLAIKLWGDQKVTQFITATGKMTDSEVMSRLDKEIEGYKEYGVQYWPIFLLDTEQHIGCCGLRPYDMAKKIYELGVHIKKEFWGKGYAGEACRKVISYAFDTLGASALFAGHNPKNEASARMLKKVGFVYTHDEFYEPTGLNHPSYLLEKPYDMDGNL